MAEEMTHTTEKVYCYDHPSAYQNNNALIGALMSKNQCDPTAMMAMMNNNNWNSNPFIWLVFLAWMNGGMWGNRTDAAQNADLSRQMQTLQGSVTDNHNNDIALAAINGNRDAMGQLAQTFNTDITAIQTAICGVKSAIEQVGGTVGYTAESVKNAIALGDRDIIQQMCNCCCQQKELTQRMGYESQLATERQTNILGGAVADLKASSQLQTCQQTNALTNNINDVRQAVVNGFANIGYQNSQNTAQIIQASQANTQRILDQMCANTTQELRDKLAQMSQDAQTASIVAQLKSCGCGC